MFDRILAPSDGSEAAEQAMHTAVELAEIHDAAVKVLYVIDTSVYLRHARVADTIISELEEDAEEVTDEAADYARQTEGEMRTEIVRGVPHEEIQDHADEHDMDLIVMGTHGRTGLKRAILGSVTEWIVMTSDIPVLTVKETGDVAALPQ